jgi:hypothetical protein
MPVHDWRKVTPNVFHHFHTAWLSEISSALNRGILPDDHFAALEQTAGEAIPDVITLPTSSDDFDGRLSHGDEGAVAVAERPPRVDITAESDLFLMRQKRIVVHHPLGDVVAFIELVSPENKRTPKSLDRFLTKVLSAIEQEQHVLVLDVLPPGKHDPAGMHGAIWQELSERPYDPPPGRPLTLSSYKAAEVKRAYVQPLAVGQSLPAMPIFLDPDWYVEVPLEETYQEAWEGAPRPWRAMLSGA